ncbi:MAG: family N-acetyltransferase [Rhodocyclales bacterium]|nr:family N-acetyltransferase [Rhodocyclales bacterium]
MQNASPESAPFKTRVVRPDELTTNERARWQDLLSSSNCASAFLSPAYALAAEKAFGNVRVCIFEHAGVIQAFFAFSLPMLGNRLLGAGVPLAGSFSDYVGIIAQPDFRVTPDQLLRASGLSTFLFTHLDETQSSHGMTGSQPRKGLRIRTGVEGDFLAELAQRDKKFFQDTERRHRKLERDHGTLRFALEEPGSAMLDWLIDTKIAQYRRTGRNAHPFSAKADRDFLHFLAAQDDPLCKPRLTTLYCNDKPIAAHFGLQCVDTLAYWFPVYDTAFHSYSPGRLLMWETLKRGRELGIRCVDRGEGDTQAKRDFANEEHLYFRDYYARKNLSAFIDRGLNSLRWRLEAKRAKPEAE